jgi:hypothetical protein
MHQQKCGCHAHPLLGGAKLMTLPYKVPGVGLLLSTFHNTTTHTQLHKKRNRQTLKFAGPHVCVVKLRNCNKSLPLSHYAFGRQQDSCVNAFLKRGREMISDIYLLVMSNLSKSSLLSCVILRQAQYDTAGCQKDVMLRLSKQM